MRMLQGLALRSASAGLAASAIGLAGYTMFQLVTGLQLGQEVDWLKAWRTTAETRVERAGTEVGDAERSADTVRSVLEANQRLQSNKLDPIAPLQALRQAMAQSEQLLSVIWQTDGGDDAGRSPRGDDPERQSDDFILDLTFDLGRRADRSAAIAAVEAADRFAARLADSFPERPILIRRQAASILPDESFVGGAGLIAEPVVDSEMSAELRIGRRRR
jgi:hypothetical protein